MPVMMITLYLALAPLLRQPAGMNGLEAFLQCTGFWAYLVSGWSPERKAAFYSVHRFLGSATLLTAFTAIAAGLAECQTFDIFAQKGIKGFYNDFAYSLVSIVLPIMTLMVLLQALVVVYNLMHGQQAIPVSSSVPSTKAANGVKASV